MVRSSWFLQPKNKLESSHGCKWFNSSSQVAYLCINCLVYIGKLLSRGRMRCPEYAVRVRIQIWALNHSCSVLLQAAQRSTDLRESAKQHRHLTPGHPVTSRRWKLSDNLSLLASWRAFCRPVGTHCQQAISIATPRLTSTLCSPC